MYIRMRATLGNTVSRDRFGSISAPLVNQPVVLLVQLNVRMEEKVDNNLSGWFGTTEEVHQCI
jgi:hypothetical protein